jgi:hypothetical protein
MHELRKKEQHMLEEMDYLKDKRRKRLLQNKSKRKEDRRKKNSVRHLPGYDFQWDEREWMDSVHVTSGR